MSVVQTSVTARPVIARPGQEYDTAFTDVVSGIASEAFNFGEYVVRKATGWAKPASAADVTDFEGGVALIDESLPTEVGYVEGDNVRVMTRGRVAVSSGEAVALTDALFIGTTGADAGKFRTDDTDAIAANMCRVWQAVDAGTVIITLNRPAQFTAPAP